METETLNWIPKEGESIYYNDVTGATIPGVIQRVFWMRENEVRDFPPMIKVRLNHPDHERDVTRIVKYKNLQPQTL